MLIDLVDTTTSDGVKLHGMLLEPEERRDDFMVDAVLMVHGSGGNFYASPSNLLTVRLRDMGITAALFNTRGHDTISDRSGDHRIGNAYELLSETHLDIKAAVDFLVQRGCRHICIWGKSLGAVRAVIAQAKNQDPNVAGVISLGPLRFSHKYFSESEMGEEHLKNYEEAKALVAAGKPDQIMLVNFPNPNAYFSARVYLDRHCSEQYDITKGHTDKITCPLLILTGTEERHPRMLNVGRDMYELTKDHPNVTWKHFEGGSHSLSNMEEAMFETILQWLRVKTAAGATA